MTTSTNSSAADPAASATSDAAGPLGDAAALRITRGEPTPEELAALVAVLAARSTADDAGPAEPQVASGWTDRARYVRSGRLEFGARSGWRASTLPR